MFLCVTWPDRRELPLKVKYLYTIVFVVYNNRDFGKAYFKLIKSDLNAVYIKAHLCG